RRVVRREWSSPAPQGGEACRDGSERSRAAAFRARAACERARATPATPRQSSALESLRNRSRAENLALISTPCHPARGKFACLRGTWESKDPSNLQSAGYRGPSTRKLPGAKIPLRMTILRGSGRYFRRLLFFYFSLCGPIFL